MVLSVIICTHNPRSEPLARTLESLKAQSFPKSSWELLLVDNASTQKLSSLWDLSYHPNARHIREDELGLTPARLRGIVESRGQLLVFVDDDNVLVPDYLQRAFEIAAQFPFLGAFGSGALLPEFEEQPVPKVTGVLPMLALRNVPAASWTNAPHVSQLRPWGAGLCVQRSVAEEYRRLVERMRTSVVLDRRGSHLFSGGDDLFSWAAAATNLGFGIFPELRITHLIAANRVRPPYLLRLLHDHRFSHGILNYLLKGESPRRLRFGECIRIALHGLRRGLFAMRCRWAAASGENKALSYLKQVNLSPLSTPPNSPLPAQNLGGLKFQTLE